MPKFGLRLHRNFSTYTLLCLKISVSSHLKFEHFATKSIMQWVYYLVKKLRQKNCSQAFFHKSM